LVNKSKLYVATDAGEVNIFDIKTAKNVKTIKVEKIKDFVGDLVDSKVYSVDVLEDSILVLSQTSGGFRRVDINVNGKRERIIDASDYLAIAKAKFLNKDTIILALLSNEIISFDIKSKAQNWACQASGAKFSNFVLDEKREKIVIADESGDLKIYSTKEGKFIKKLSGQNLDNVFQVDMKEGVIATAGQDRRVVIYEPFSAYYKSAPFLIYSVGLSPSGKRVGYASDENNNVTVFNTKTKETIATLGGNKMTLTNILFLNENEVFVASDDSTVNFYKIK
jgi:WD40 repeat protein